MASDPAERIEILIADDEESICFSLRRTLERKGFVVHVVADGQLAIERVRERSGRIRAAFLDILMPRFGGLEALQAIRVIDPGLRICFMTAHRHAPHVRESLDRSSVPILDKPFALGEFVAALEGMLASEPATVARCSTANHLQTTLRTTRARRVALAFPPHLGPWNEFVRGVLRFARSTESWFVTLHPSSEIGVALADNPDGLIGMVRSGSDALKLKEWGGPAVDTAHDLPDLPLTRVGFDEVAIGTIAADHLLALGRRHIAFLGIDGAAYSQQTQRGFVERLRESNTDCEIAPLELWGRPGGISTPDDRGLGEWLLGLPRPAAIFAIHDALALRISETIRAAGLKIPEDIAILGVLDDELLCLAARPPLSSVRVPAPAVGYRAAQILEGMMNGKKPPRKRVELPPLGIAARQSTDLTAAADPELAAALRFIREHMAERIGVEDIVAASTLSRSSLERRFRASINRSPLEELHRIRLERAEQLLAETDLSLDAVARAAGFRDAVHLTVTFKNKGNLTPAQFRALHHRV